MLLKNTTANILRRIVCRSISETQQSKGISVAECPDDRGETVDEVDWENARPYKAIPGPSKYQLVRGFLPGGKFYDTSINEFFGILRKEYGDFLVMPGVFGKKDVVMTLHPRIYRRILRNEGIWPIRKNFDSGVYFRNVYRKDYFKGVGGLIMSSGESWANFRTLVNPILMQPKNAKQYLNKMIPVSNEFLQRIRDIRDPTTLEMPSTFVDDINRLTFESVAVIALDQQLGLIRGARDIPEAELLFKCIHLVMDLSFKLDVQPSIWKIVKTPTFYRLMTVYDNIFKIISRYIDESLDRIKRNPVSKDDNEQQCVIEKLVETDKTYAVVMAMDMLMAGVETATTTFTGILLCLATNPDKQTKLRGEIRQILPQKKSEPNLDNMKNLPYLRACIKEGIRMYPIGPGTVRTMPKDIVINGYQIPKGTDMAMGNNVILREAKYFVKPNDYIPERWLRTTESDSYKSEDINPFVYLPFGFGPRSCVGKRIVELELELMIMRLIRNFNVEFNYSIENAFKTTFMARPNIPLKFKFSELQD